MYKVDYSDFNKFIVSLGVGCILLAFLVPWLFLRELGSWLAPTTSLSGLLPEARGLLETRCHIAHTVMAIIPYYTSSFFLLGFALMIWGLTRWHGNQKVLDEQAILSKDKLKREVQRMSDDQIERKTAEEVSEYAIPEIEQAVQEIPEPSGEQPDMVNTKPAVSLTEDIAQHRAIEDAVAQKVYECFSGRYNVLHNHRLKWVEFDILMQAISPGYPDFAVEIKYSPRGFKDMAAQAAAFKLITGCLLYREMFHRDIVPVLLMLTRDERSPEPIVDVSNLRRTLDEIRIVGQARQMGVNLTAHFTTFEDFQGLSCEELDRLFLGQSRESQKSESRDRFTPHDRFGRSDS